MPAASRKAPEGYISTTEAGERLGLSSHTIRMWAHAGELDFVRSGGKEDAGYIWVLETDVEDLERKSYSRDEEITKHYAERVLKGLEAHRESLETNQHQGFEYFDRLLKGQERVTERLDSISERLEDTARYQERVTHWLERIDPSRIRIDPPGESGGGSVSVSMP